jgi:glycosyltransferase involved in cell wall biosynthesis
VCEICVSQKFPLAGVRYKCYHTSSLQSAVVTAITGVHKILGTWKSKVATYIALTHFAKNRFLKSSLEISPDKIEVIPNFVVDHGVGSFPREDFFLFVGRLSIEKGLFTLLEAFSNLPTENVVIAGEGPEEINFKRSYGQFKNIKFLGKLSREHIIALMKKCKALIFPSIWFEGLPFTIIESFSTGTPVIAARLGAMEEMIEDSFNGFHFEAGNAEGLKNALRRFNELNAVERQNMYYKARLSYEEKYNPEAHYRDIITVYRKAIQYSKK